VLEAYHNFQCSQPNQLYQEHNYSGGQSHILLLSTCAGTVLLYKIASGRDVQAAGIKAWRSSALSTTCRQWNNDLRYGVPVLKAPHAPVEKDGASSVKQINCISC